MKRKTLLTILQLVIFVGLGVGILLYMSGKLSEKEKEDMMASIRSTRLWMVVPVLLAGLSAHVARALRWKLMLEPLGIHPSSANTIFSVLVGYIANLVLPRAGEVAKCTVLARYEKVPADKMVGTIVSERIWDVVCLVIVIVLTLLLEGDVIGDFAAEKLSKISDKGPSLFFALGVVGLFVIGAILFVRRRKESKIGRFLLGMGAGVGSILRMKKRWAFIGYTFLIWGFYLLQILIGFWSMPITEHLGVSVGLSVLVFGSIGMIATQGGIGAYTYLIAEILLFYGLSQSEGQAFGWVSWVAQTLIVIVLGIAALVLLPLYNRKPRHAQAAVDSGQNS